MTAISRSAPVDTLSLIKAALRNPGAPDALAKAGIRQSTSLTNYDLDSPARSMIPVQTPLRNETPRVQGIGGEATNWKSITAINLAMISAGVSEGNRGGIVTTGLVDKMSAYQSIGLEDQVTFEAELAAEGFDDVKALSIMNLLRATMIQEESLLLGGNTSMPLGTTPTPALSASASGGAIGAGVVVSVIAVALALDGYGNASLGSGLPIGPINRTNADGSIDADITVGVARKSAAASVTVSGGSTNSVSASVSIVNGAVAYAWYVATAGVERLVAITTINSCVFTSIPVVGQLASALPAADLSADPLAFDGLLTQALLAGSGAYVVDFATGSPGIGTVLNSDNAGGIAEFITAFQYFWENFRISPDTAWCNTQEILNITRKVIANGGAPLVQFTQSASAPHRDVTGGARVNSILNPFTRTMVKLRIHPNQAPGTVLFTTSELPYPLPGVDNAFQVKTRKEMHLIEWLAGHRRYEYGVYADETLQHFATFSLGVFRNIANG